MLIVALIACSDPGDASLSAAHPTDPAGAPPAPGAPPGGVTTTPGEFAPPPPGGPQGPPLDAQGRPITGLQGPQRGPDAPGISAEDLTTSWDAALGVPVAPLPRPATCPDADRDGFVDAWTCPATPPEQADCDDTDARVTPATERFVRPGPFLMGSASIQAGVDEGPVHVVTLAGYCLERTERAGADGAPLEGLSWSAAREVCEGEGLHLPTEAQWEKAARGGCEGGAVPGACDPGDLRPYPWGADAPSCRNANFQAIEGGAPRLCEGKAHPVVEARNTGPYGHVELAGNVWEWVADRYHLEVYGHAPARVDPTGPTYGELHVLRGGGWNTYGTNMRVANRFVSVVQGSAVGVRCARGGGAGRADDVPPVEMVTLSGELIAEGVELSGVQVSLAAFDADLVGTAGVAAGRSPVVEAAVPAQGGARQAFRFDVPKGRHYLVTAGLDAGSTDNVGARPRSGSGGAGEADAPVYADRDRDGITIRLRPLGVYAAGAPLGSGADLQDPTGFPPFHATPPPGGPEPGPTGAFGAPVALSPGSEGGYRPQLAVASDGTLHVVYYVHRGESYVIVHRSSPDGVQWSDPVAVSPEAGRNWGPDLVTRPDGSVVVSWDRLEGTETSGWVRVRDAAGRWGSPRQVVAASNEELSSVHVASLGGDDLTFVWIARPSDGSTAFRAWSRALRSGTLQAPVPLSDGSVDAWHSNVHRTGNGAVFAGWDEGAGGSSTLLHVARWVGGQFQAEWDAGRDRAMGERPNFAEAADGNAWVTWFEKRASAPVEVYARGRSRGAWGEVERVSANLGGYVFDPDSTVTRGGDPLIVFGWDGGAHAELVWSTRSARGWSAPARVANIGWGKPGLPSVDTAADGRVYVAWAQWERGESHVWVASRAP